MQIQTVIGRSLAIMDPDTYKKYLDSVTPMLSDTRFIEDIYLAIKTNHPTFDETDTRIIFVATVYDCYCPASFLPKATMKLPIGVRDEAARILGYDNPENINSWRNIASAYIKGKSFRARVDAIKDQFKQYSVNPAHWELQLI